MSPEAIRLSAIADTAAAEKEALLSDEARLVRDTLVHHGLETPMIDNGLSAEQKYRRIEALMREVVETLGLDLSDDSLAETPHRIAKMYVREIFSGLDYSEFPKLSLIDNKMGVNEMVKVRDIELVSTCEHHFVTIDGTAKVAYMPKDEILGLSRSIASCAFSLDAPRCRSGSRARFSSPCRRCWARTTLPSALMRPTTVSNPAASWIQIRRPARPRWAVVSRRTSILVQNS